MAGKNVAFGNLSHNIIVKILTNLYCLIIRSNRIIISITFFGFIRELNIIQRIKNIKSILLNTKRLYFILLINRYDKEDKNDIIRYFI